MALKKTQRVKTIQTIANHLSPEDWTTIDLTLKQFGFPITDDWSSDKKSYVVKMVADGDDEDLLELAEHFGLDTFGSSSGIATVDDRPYWEEGKLRAFISHLSGNKKQATDLQAQLGSFGVSCFVAHKDIHPTSEWQTEIETALSTCELLIALVYPDFQNSQWCDQEIGYALGRGVPVFSIRCGADPTGFVSRFQAFTGSGKTSAVIAQEIFEAAIIHKKLQRRMADILVNLFVNSGSFSTAKRRIGYLERLKVWDPSYSTRIAQSVADNDQVRGSWGVPEQVEQLIAKWS